VPHSHIPRCVCSWDGFEAQRIKIREAAIEIRDSDAALRALVPSVQATGHIGNAIRDISTASTPEVDFAFSSALLADFELLSFY